LLALYIKLLGHVDPFVRDIYFCVFIQYNQMFDMFNILFIVYYYLFVMFNFLFAKIFFVRVVKIFVPSIRN
jgi:hypothetical protein